MDTRGRDHAEILAVLHQGAVSGRRLPQTVAADLVRLGVGGSLDGRGRQLLTDLAVHASPDRSPSSMPAIYGRHPGLARAVEAAYLAMRPVADAGGVAMIPAPDAGDPVAIASWLEWANGLLGGACSAGSPVRRGPRARIKSASWNDGYSYTWRDGSRGRRGDSHGHVHPASRLTAEERREMLPGLSVRGYRRAVAAVDHLEQRRGVLAAARDREAAAAFGKARLASTLSFEAFAADTATAAFVAYYVARLGLRTVFTNGQQARPMDELGESLLSAAMAGPGFRPDVVATVLTRQTVLDRLTEREKGVLLGTYYQQMATFSRSLARCFDVKRDRTRMVARPGDDSSTWNAASRAFNQARTGWLALLAGLGLESVGEAWCPGKVPALVAADVAHWHATSGSSEHHDVEVFANLPLPWLVISGEEACGAATIREACARRGIDADTSGWTRPYRQNGTAATAPAPELVHGVVFASPVLAHLLRTSPALAGGLAGRARLAGPGEA